MAGLTAAVAVLLLVVAVGSSITALWLNSALTRRSQTSIGRFKPKSMPIRIAGAAIFWTLGRAA